MRHLRNVRPTVRRLPAVGLLALLLAAAGCEDELNNPQSFECDELLEIAIEEVPASLRYLVSTGGSAVVESVTYTTPAGDVTTTDLDHQAPNDIIFDETVEFDAPVEAILRAQGEVATGGQIGIAYTIVFDDGSRIDGNPSVCGA
ncbi:MAG TPA: hypothetical protein VLA33_00305 [Gemmatimonadota bacterium]|nr:hypothetical protein [Gemmatimonadota bacterium]